MCIKIILNPRNYKYKTKFKKRKFVSYQNNFLQFGDFGIKALQSILIDSKLLFKFKLYLKKSTKRSDKTRRYFWTKIFPDFPITRKPQGLRMGKGKGKLKIWACYLKAGSIIFETKNLRYGRAIYFCKQILVRLPIKILFIFSYFFFFKKNIFLKRIFF